ncbi:hypothetical protein HDU93_002065 [Gonapodya sp. JEL0774]|nr:hypothetical protein HDU93_002065 [Gonapodya sp. JEL0774]
MVSLTDPERQERSSVSDRHPLDDPPMTTNDNVQSTKSAGSEPNPAESMNSSTLTPDLEPDISKSHQDDVKIPLNIVAEKEAAVELQLDEPPDGGFDAWGTVFAYFIISFVSVGSLFSWSVYLRYYFQSNIFPGTSQTTFTLGGGLANAAGCLIAPFLGTLADRHGYRVVVFSGSIVVCLSYIITSFAGPGQVWMVVLFQGAVNGMGSQACWMVALAAIPGWFGKRRGFAMSLASTGAGVGGLAMTNLTQYLFDRVGHVWTLRITGFLAIGGEAQSAVGATISCTFESLNMNLHGPLAAIAPASLLVKTRTPPRPKTGPLLDLSAFRDQAFILLFLASAIMNFAYSLPLFFMTTVTFPPTCPVMLDATSAYGTSIGLTAQTAAFILGIQNAVTSPSRIVIGLIMDRIGAVNVFLICNLVGGVLCLTLWPNARTLGSLLAFALVVSEARTAHSAFALVVLIYYRSIQFGATGAQFFSQMPIVVSAVFGPRDSASKIGLVMLSLTLGEKTYNHQELT